MFKTSGNRLLDGNEMVLFKAYLGIRHMVFGWCCYEYREVPESRLSYQTSERLLVRW